MKTKVRIRPSFTLLLAACVAATGTAWASYLAEFAVRGSGHWPGSISMFVEVLSVLAFLGLIGGILPAGLLLALTFRIVGHVTDFPFKYALAGGVAGMVWLAIAWPTRPASEVWPAFIGLADTPISMLWLFTGHMLFAGSPDGELTVPMALAPVVGGSFGGALYGRFAAVS